MKNKPYLKYATVAVALSLSIVAGQANASKWAFTTSGRIDRGQDLSNIFGVAGGDLEGLSYTDVVTLDPELYSNHSVTGSENHASGILTGSATNTLTINGITQVFTWDLAQPNSGASVLVNYITQFGVGYVPGTFGGTLPNIDQIAQNQDGKSTNGEELSVYFSLFSTVNAYNLGLGFDQNWSYYPHVGSLNNVQDQILVHIEHFNSNGQLDYNMNATPDFFAINKVADTPLPKSYSLLLTGLGLIGFMARRKFSGMV